MEARESSRQEIAKRLRNKYRERNAPGMFEAQDVGMQAYNYLKDLESCLPDGDSMFTVIADLIDPTCRNRLDEFERMAPLGMRTDNFVCSSCGETFCADPDGVNFPIDWAYCPNCGARITRITEVDG